MTAREGADAPPRRTALVTGAGSGIGRAVALALAREGLRVIGVGRRPAALAETAALLAPGGAGTFEALAADVRETGWRAEVERRAPAGVDVLVHVAMAYAPFVRLEQSRPADERPVFETGLLAALELARHALPGMRARGFGRIVLVGSMAGSLGAPGQAAYAAAKSGLVGLARSLALEGARDGVTCNLLELGLVDTPRVRETFADERWRRLVAATPVGRAGKPEEVARAVLWLVSEDAAFVTGACIPVSGGLGLGLVPREDGDG